MKLFRSLAAATLVLCCAFTAQAQQLVLRSGDHPTFSRVTIPLPASQNWEARRTKQGVELSLPDFSGGFDTTSVFVRMRRDRIAEIRQMPGGLILDVACACDATAFRSGPLLVIDVGDQKSAMAGPLLASPDVVEVQPVRPRLPGSQSMTANQTVPITRPSSNGALPWIGGNSPFAVADDQTIRPPQGLKESKPESNNADERVALLTEIQESLIAEVANAASAGLLESSYAAPPSPSVLPENRSSSISLEPKPLPAELQNASQNMRITNSMDLPLEANAGNAQATPTGLICPINNFLSIESWGDDSGFAANIGPARNALMNARDQLDRTAAERLVQVYIYYGFGAEAINTLKLDSALAAEHPHLAAVATILEHGSVDGRNALAEYTDCASDVALWATLSFANVPSGTLIDTNATLRALNRLPKHLRQIVAPALSERLLGYGDPSAAHAAMRSIERLPDPITPQAALAQAELAINKGDPAEDSLKKIIDKNTGESPQALIKLVEGKLARDEPLSYETATLVEAYVQELRGTPMGNQLRSTQVIALGQSKHFDEAFEALEVISPSLSPEAAAILRKDISLQLVAKADDLTFLEHMFKYDSVALEALPTPLKLKLAARIMDLGFAAQVQQTLAAIPIKPRTATRQILAARAALSLRQPFHAQTALIGIDTPEAGLLLAQAKQMAGAYQEAADLFASNDAPERAAQASWLSEDWKDLTLVDTPGFGAVATLAQDQERDVDPALGPLGRADRALQESAAARSMLEQLLLDPAVQVSSGS